MSALVGLLAVAAYAFAIGGLVLVRDKGRADRFGDELAFADAGARRTGLVAPLLDGLGHRAAPLLTRLVDTPDKRDRIQRRLEAAGRPNGITVDRYIQRKAAFFVLFLVTAIVLTLRGLWFSAIPILVLGWIWTDLEIDGKARRRQARMDKDLPDFLDVLAVCVNAGIAFRPAMSRVADAFEGPVSEEVTTTLRQMSLGASRREAFEALRDRNPSEFVATFVSAFLQAEELGVPLGKGLVDLATDMRRAAYQRARRRAQRAAPRVSLIVTLIIMPGAILLILAGMVLGSDIDLGVLRGS